MIKIKLQIIIYIFFFICTNLSAQNQPDTTDKEKKNKFSIETEYTNNQLYNGRYDSVVIPYQSLTFQYEYKGLKLSTTAYYYIQKKIIDLYEIDASYTFNLSKKFSLDITGSKYFYDSKTNNVKNTITANLGLNLNYDFNIFNSSINTSYLIGNKNDINIAMSLSKEIDLNSNKITFLIEPNLTMEASTLEYFNANITKKAVRQAFSNLEFELSTTSNIKGLNILDYQLGLTTTIGIKNLEITFNPIFIIPVNPITTTTTIKNLKTGRILREIETTPISERNLANFLYFGISFVYKIH